MADSLDSTSAPRARSGASRVAAGILASRVAGFLRDRALAHVFGLSAYADVFRTALRGPNVLQNLLGEGSLSASFIPIYSRLLAEGKREEAGRFAGAVFGLLLAAAGAVALLGVVAARPIVMVLSSGYLQDAAKGAAVDRFPLAVAAVRWIFPMTGVLVLSAWALGVLNSHRRFFLAYFAPVLWNAAIIAAVWWAWRGGGGLPEEVLRAACIGALVGGILQFGVQLPLVVRLLRGFALSVSLDVPGVRAALGALGPAMAGRGALQLAAYLDQWLAAFLAPGAVAALALAFSLYALPAALFGTAVAAAELPELSSVQGADRRDALRLRLREGLLGVGFSNVAATVGYLAFGYVAVGALYRTGDFRVADNWLAYLVLAGFTLGLLPGGFSRLLQNVYYAFGDTRTPARIAVQRVVLSAALGLPLMLAFDRVALATWLGPGTPLRLGAVGLATATGLAAWLELWLLLRRLPDHLPGFAFPGRALVRMGLAGFLAAIPAALVWWIVRSGHPILQAVLVLGAFGAAYLGVAQTAGIAQAAAWTQRLQTLVRRGRTIGS